MASISSSGLTCATTWRASAQEADPEGVVEQAFRDVIVNRGDGPMAPRDMIVMQMPAEAVRIGDAEADPDAPDSDVDPGSEA